MTTWDQLHACGVLTDYTDAEIERMVEAARPHMPGCTDEEVYDVVLVAMRKDHATRAREQHRRSVGQPVLRLLQGGRTEPSDPEERVTGHLRLLQGGVIRHAAVDREGEWAALEVMVKDAVEEETPHE